MRHPPIVLASLLAVLASPLGASAQEAPRKVADLEFAVVGGQSLKLDLYLPKTRATPPPLVVWIHGGGWEGGSKASCPLKWLARFNGYAVASISYRLTDKAIFPAQIQDCKAAVRWLRLNAKRLGYSADKIVVAGASAGGMLAALMGTSGDVAALEGQPSAPERASLGAAGRLAGAEGAKAGAKASKAGAKGSKAAAKGAETGTKDAKAGTLASSRVQGVIDFFGATDFVLRSQTQPKRANTPGSVVARLLGGGADKEVAQARLASATQHVTPDDPPMLVFHGAKDTVVLPDQSQAIAEAYRKAKLPLELVVLPKAGHGGKAFYWPQRRKIVAFLDKVLKPRAR